MQEHSGAAALCRKRASCLGLLQKRVIKVPGSPGKSGECQAATPEVMNLFFIILIYLANLHPGVWKELAEEQSFLNVIL